MKQQNKQAKNQNAFLFVSASVTEWYVHILGDGKCRTCVTSQTKGHKTTSFVAGANTGECSSIETKLFQWKMRDNKNQEEEIFSWVFFYPVLLSFPLVKIHSVYSFEG